MFTVQPTVIELVTLVATVVHCTLIKHRENLICSLVFLIYLTIRMRIILKSESAVYTASRRGMYTKVRFSYGIIGPVSYTHLTLPTNREV